MSSSLLHALRLALTLTLAVAPLAGCDDDDDGSDEETDGEGLHMQSLEGDYDITAFVDDESELDDAETPTCRVSVEDARVTASCSKRFEGAFESLSLDVDLAADEIFGALVYAYEPELDDDDDCWSSYREVTTIAGATVRGRPATVSASFSPFAAFAGRWTGDLTIEKAVEVKRIADPDDDCETPETELIGFQIDAEVGGGRAVITWEGDEDTGLYDVAITDRALSVNGEVIAR